MNTLENTCGRNIFFIPQPQQCDIAHLEQITTERILPLLGPEEDVVIVIWMHNLPSKGIFDYDPKKIDIIYTAYTAFPDDCKESNRIVPEGIPPIEW